VRFGSVCSGIEAASVAWHPLGWQAAWLSEIEPFPSAVLAHHYPDVPNLGDMTLLPERILSGEVEAPDLFCGGTPCQAFSVAGLRNSLDDARGNLSLTFVGIANAIDHVRSLRREPAGVIFWENVPGVLSTKDNAFGCFLAGLAGEDNPLEPAGGKWTNAGYVLGPKRAVAWRLLDAQYFGVAQRRKRVFVVASARADFDPAAVLFEFDGVRRDIAPSRQSGQTVTGTIEASLGRSRGAGTPTAAVTAHRMISFGEYSEDGTASAMKARDYKDATDLVAQPIPIDTMNHIGRGDNHSFGDFEPGAPSYTLTKGHSHAVAQPVGFTRCDHGGDAVIDGTPTMRCGSNYSAHLAASIPNMAVRRLTPVECERLQGFPDGYTQISWRKKPADECPDGPRYKALGNSWAVPVVRWIGKRIQENLK